MSEMKTSVVLCKPHTGRTHQIRAHLADIGHPLLQDALYGGAQAERRLREGPVREAVRLLSRHGLQAANLSFSHPLTEERLEFDAPLPEDLSRIASLLQDDGAMEHANRDKP